jgi:hypothetical protein
MRASRWLRKPVPFGPNVGTVAVSYFGLVGFQYILFADPMLEGRRNKLNVKAHASTIIQNGGRSKKAQTGGKAAGTGRILAGS